MLAVQALALPGVRGALVEPHCWCQACPAHVEVWCTAWSLFRTLELDEVWSSAQACCRLTCRYSAVPKMGGSSRAGSCSSAARASCPSLRASWKRPLAA